MGPLRVRFTFISLEALAEPVGHFDEDGAAVAAKAGFELRGERALSIVIYVVIVADIERRAGIRRPAKKKLAFEIGRAFLIDPALKRWAISSSSASRTRQTMVLRPSCINAMP